MRKRGKKIIVLLIAAVMAMSMNMTVFASGEMENEAKVQHSDGTETPYTSLNTALSRAKSGETVTVLKDIPAGADNRRFEIDKSITVDLGDHKISSPQYCTFLINKYAETIEVTLKNGVIENEASNPTEGLKTPVLANQRVKLNLENITLRSAGDNSVPAYGLRIGNNANKGPEVIVQDCEIYGKDGGIAVLGQGEKGSASLIVNNSKVTGGNFGIVGNGTYDNTDITVNGGTIESQDETGAAIYHPQDGNLTINGGSLKGSTGVQYLGAGKVSISGGTITATSRQITPVIQSGDGVVHDGAALSVISRGGGYGAAGKAEVSVTGGTFISENNVAIREYAAEGSDTLIQTLEITQAEGEKLSVSGGSGQASVQLDKMGDAKAEAITGGTFSSDVSAYYDDVKYMQNAQNAAENPGEVVPRSYTITYSYAGGALPAGKSNPASYTYFDDAINLENPVRAGYIFAGWTGTGISQASKDVSIPNNSSGNRSYTATWITDPNGTGTNVEVKLPGLSSDGSPSATVPDTNVVQELKEKGLTVLEEIKKGEVPEEIEQQKAEEIKELIDGMASGEQVTVFLSVQAEEIQGVDAAEEKKIMSVAAEGEQPAVYFDISVMMTVNVENESGIVKSVKDVRLNSVSEPILFEIHVNPELVRGKSVRFAHVHEGVAEIIYPDSIDRENGVVKIYASKFSTYALLTSDRVTVTFDSKGGSKVEPQTVPFNSVVTKPKDPKKAGYAFAGWYRDESYNDIYDFTSLVERSFTLYAKWTQDTGAQNTPGQNPDVTKAVKTGDTGGGVYAILIMLAAAAAAAALRLRVRLRYADREM